MKKSICLFLIFAMLLTIFNVGVYAKSDSGISVLINNQPVVFDVEPQLIDGRTMVPLRAIFEALGAEVFWDADLQKVTAVKDTTVVEAIIGNHMISVNGETSRMDVSPALINGRTLVPVRFVAEAFDCDVKWDGDNKIVDITMLDITEIEENPEEVGNEMAADEQTDAEYITNIASKLSAGDGHVALVRPDSTLLMWGDNQHNQIKQENVSGVFAPIEIMNDVKKVSLGANHTLVLKNDGKLYAWGHNSCSQVLGSNGSDFIMENIVDIAARENFSAALNADGEVYVWGDNSKHQLLGIIGVPKIDTPTKILDNCKKIFAYKNCLVAFTGDELLVTDNSAYSRFYSMKDDSALKFRSRENVDIIINGENTKAVLGYLSNVEQVNFSKNMLEVVIKGKTEKYNQIKKNSADDLIVCENFYIVDDKIYDTNVSAGKKCVVDDVLYGIYADCGTIIVILKDGSVYAWGSDRYGTIGNGKTSKNNHASMPAYVTKIELNAVDYSKVVPISFEITNEDIKTGYLYFKFIDKDGNVVKPIGEMQIIIKDYHSEYSLIDENNFFISEQSYDSEGIAKIYVDEFLIEASTKGYGMALCTFKDVGVKLVAESGKISGFVKITNDTNSSSGSSGGYNSGSSSSASSSSSQGSNAAAEYCRKQINSLISERNSLPRNVRVYTGGRWKMTYDINEYNRLTNEIEYWQSLLKLYQ